MLRSLGSSHRSEAGCKLGCLYGQRLQLCAKEFLVGFYYLDPDLPGLSGITSNPYYFAARFLVFVLQ